MKVPRESARAAKPVNEAVWIGHAWFKSGGRNPPRAHPTVSRKLASAARTASEAPHSAGRRPGSSCLTSGCARGFCANSARPSRAATRTATAAPSNTSSPAHACMHAGRHCCMSRVRMYRRTALPMTATSACIVAKQAPGHHNRSNYAPKKEVWALVIWTVWFGRSIVTPRKEAPTADVLQVASDDAGGDYLPVGVEQAAHAGGCGRAHAGRGVAQRVA